MAINVPSWPVARAAVIEIVGTLLTVKLLVPMSGLEQAVSIRLQPHPVYWSRSPLPKADSQIKNRIWAT